MNFDMSYYKGKRVLVTGHTGFKGSWMCRMLQLAGAQVIGYATEPPTDPSLFEVCRIAEGMDSRIGDIRDLASLQKVFDETKPEIVIHMAAQPLVRESYANPVYTYETNVLGTVNVLECVRNCDSVRSVINVTTDKVYRNYEREAGYREEEELCGYDPYSNSKSCSELVTSSYRDSFLAGKGIPVTTMRAGNVIGGGDFAVDRIIPDCIRAASDGNDIVVRNPYSTRPYQHVLEPVYAYLLMAALQEQGLVPAGAYNIGPDDEDCLTTGALTTLFCEKWNAATGENITWINRHDGGPHEAGFLKLDATKLKETAGWSPKWHMDTTMAKIIEWSDAYRKGGDVLAIMDAQIAEFLEGRS